MRVLSVITVGALCLAASLCGKPSYGADDAACASVKQQASDVAAWFGTSNTDGPAWKKHLLWESLEVEIAKGEAADRARVLALVRRLSSGTPGTAAEPFVRLRNALVDWSATLPPPSAGQLPALVRDAKQTFLVYTLADLTAAKAKLTAAVDRLEARLQSAGATGNGWRTYLQFDALKQQVARPAGPELTALDAAHRKLAAGHDGLRLVAFTDVRDAARRYVLVARAIGDAKVRTQYESVLEGLAKQLEIYGKSPTAENVHRINLSLEWLDQTAQGKWAATAIRRRLSRPNLMARVSNELIASRLAMVIDDTSPVGETILGAAMEGTGHTVGRITSRLLPSSDTARIELLFRGTVDTDTVSVKGAVQVYTTGTTELNASKLLEVDSRRITAMPAESSASVSSTIQDVRSTRGRKFIEQFAWKRALKLQPKAEAIGAQRAEFRFNERMDEQSDEMVAKANKTIDEKIRKPLIERNLFPAFVKFFTDPQSLQVVVQEDAGGFLSAPNDPPPVEDAADLFVRVHDSAINNFAAAALGGVILEEKRFQKTLTETFGLPEMIETDGDDENWSITYPLRQPIAVSFGEDTLSVTVAGREYSNGQKEYPGMNVTAVYKIQKTDWGFKGVRQGKLSIFPPGFKPDSGRQLAAREQALRTVLERRFERFFGAELVPKNIVAEVEGKEPLELTLTHWRTTRGWLAMGWKMVPATKSKPSDRPAAKTAARKANVQ